MHSQGYEPSHATSCTFPHTADVCWPPTLSPVVAGLAETYKFTPYNLDSGLELLSKCSYKYSAWLNLEGPLWSAQTSYISSSHFQKCDPE